MIWVLNRPGRTIIASATCSGSYDYFGFNGNTYFSRGLDWPLDSDHP